MPVRLGRREGATVTAARASTAPVAAAPAVAGAFYPADPDALADAGRRARSPSAPPRRRRRPRSRPRRSSSPTPATCTPGRSRRRRTPRWQPWRAPISRVVLLGPAHRVPVRSDGGRRPSTPGPPRSGSVAIDDGRAASVAGRCRGVVVDDRAHAAEHSLEVHLPFLQRVLRLGSPLLPIVVGPRARRARSPTCSTRCGAATRRSSSSAPTSSTTTTTTRTGARPAHGRHHRGRGIDDIGPARRLRRLPRPRPARGRAAGTASTSSWSTSATRATPPGTADRVVGYGAFAVESARDRRTSSRPTSAAPCSTPPLERRRSELGGAHRPRRRPSPRHRLDSAQPGATFVTLRDGERLLGCVGIDRARRAAGRRRGRQRRRRAAFADPRLPALTRTSSSAWRSRSRCSTRSNRWPSHSLRRAAAAVRPGVDGLLIEAGSPSRHVPAVGVGAGARRPTSSSPTCGTRPACAPAPGPATSPFARYVTVEFGDDGTRRADFG